MPEAEIWKDIPGYEGLYVVSNIGRVARIYEERNIVKTMFKIRKLKVNGKGYHAVNLCKENVVKWHTVHRLVLAAFKGVSKLVCNHINADRKDNRLENLEYCTPGLNIAHAFKIGNQDINGEKHPSHKLKRIHVVMMRYIDKYIKVPVGYWTDVSKRIGVSRAALYQAKNCNNWRTIKIQED